VIGYRVFLLISWVILGAILGLHTGATRAAEPETKFFIGTGGKGGVYFPTGRAICRQVNKGSRKHRIQCNSGSTAGSVTNLKAIRAGEMDMGIAQSDWHFHSYHGTSSFREEGAFEGLRSVFSLHPESFTIVARADSGIRRLRDLKGKWVNLCSPGSGQRATSNELLRALGWREDVFGRVFELPSGQQSEALCNNMIDVTMYVVGHPSSVVRNASSECDVILVNVVEPAVTRMVERRGYYRPVVIPAGLYRGSVHDTRSFGLNATLVTSDKLSEDIVYEVVRAVFDDFAKFKTFHPAFKILSKTEMVTLGLTAPLHPGAIKYYKEAGLL